MNTKPPRPCILCGTLTRNTFAVISANFDCAVGAYVCCLCGERRGNSLLDANRALQAKLDELGIRFGALHRAEDAGGHDHA